MGKWSTHHFVNSARADSATWLDEVFSNVNMRVNFVEKIKKVKKINTNYASCQPTYRWWIINQTTSRRISVSNGISGTVMSFCPFV